MLATDQQLDLVIMGNIVLPGGVRRGWVGVRDGKVATIAFDSEPPLARHVHYADRHYVLPGLIDGHVHSYSAPQERFAGATRAAAAGGVTTIVDMPYDATGIIADPEAFAEKRGRLAGEAMVDVALLATVRKHAGAGHVAALAALGACGFKVSTYETDPNRFPRLPDDQLLAVFEAAAVAGRPVLVHAENDEIVSAALQQHGAGGGDPLAHVRSRPPVAEAEAVVRVLELAAWTGAHVHIVHGSFPRIFQLVDMYRRQGVRASAETCTHYLTLCEADMARLGARGKINPPLRPAAWREGLWPLCQSGHIHMVTTDHAPWPPDRKQAANIFDNASGAPGLELMLPLLYSEGVATGRLAVTDLVRLLAENPARLFGLWGRKGAIVPGFDADLVILDPAAEWVIDDGKLQSTAGWSPYAGRPVRGRVVATYVRGHLVWDGEAAVGEPAGQFVAPHHPALEPARPLPTDRGAWE